MLITAVQVGPPPSTDEGLGAAWDLLAEAAGDPDHPAQAPLLGGTVELVVQCYGGASVDRYGDLARDLDERLGTAPRLTDLLKGRPPGR